MRRPRPHIPLPVKVRVLLRQIGELWPEDYLRDVRQKRQLAHAVNGLTVMLAQQLGCTVDELELDHDPPLRVRKFNKRTGKYTPDANDHNYLFYRPDHKTKTNVRGDHGQFPDRVLINREKKRELRLFHKRRRRRRQSWPKQRIPQRQNPWPPKGSRPFNQRRARP